MSGRLFVTSVSGRAERGGRGARAELAPWDRALLGAQAAPGPQAMSIYLSSGQHQPGSASFRATSCKCFFQCPVWGQYGEVPQSPWPLPGVPQLYLSRLSDAKAGRYPAWPGLGGLKGCFMADRTCPPGTHCREVRPMLVPFMPLVFLRQCLPP